MLKIKFNTSTKVFSVESEDDEIQDELSEDSDLTVDTKEFIGTKEPNRPFQNTTGRFKDQFKI